MSRLLSLFLLFFFPCLVFATTSYDTLFINHGTTEYAWLDYHFLAFNSSEVETVSNHPVYFDTDNLVLTIFNRDSVDHSVSIDALGGEVAIIAPMESQTVELNFENEEGVYRLYCNSARGWMLGASTILLKGYSSANSRYFWNLYDQQSGLDTLILNESITSIPISGYRPSTFTINGNIFPNTVSDTTALVQNSVGEEVIIAIVNSGKMSHTLHFHGFHVTILSASMDDHREGWVKDSFNLLPGEVMAIQLVPHQHGHYPVHNHNLIAVNTGGYPGGMITMLHIEP